MLWYRRILLSLAHSLWWLLLWSCLVCFENLWHFWFRKKSWATGVIWLFISCKLPIQILLWWLQVNTGMHDLVWLSFCWELAGFKALNLKLVAYGYLAAVRIDPPDRYLVTFILRLWRCKLLLLKRSLAVTTNSWSRLLSLPTGNICNLCALSVGI